jgi:2-methylcitrate dehydratase PrpD
MTVNTAVAADHNAPAITAQLAHFVSQHPAQGWSDAVEHEAHRTFLNWLGCAIGAAQHEAVDAALAAVQLQSMGYLKVSSIAGGFDSWVAAGKPTAKPTLPTFE